jgi:hypothetical protein
MEGAGDLMRRSRPPRRLRARLSCSLVAIAAAVVSGSATAAPASDDRAGGAAVGGLEDELEEARADVLELGQSQWRNARQSTARALFSIADVLEASDSRRAQRERVALIRSRAERLRSAGSLSAAQSVWVKSALTTSLDALDAMQVERRAAERAVVSKWTRAARRAVGSVEERDWLYLQRAAVQDGFRATIDAFLAASQSAGPCRRATEE